MEKIDKENLTALQKIRSEIKSYSLSENVLNVFKAVLSTTPLSSWLASLMADYIPSSKSQRLEVFAIQVAEDIKKVQDQVKEEYVKTDEFAFILEKCFRGAAENYQQEKIEAFRNILVNSLVRADYSSEEKEYFIHLVNSLSSLHLQILKMVKNDIKDETGHFWLRIPGVNISVTESGYNDLVRFGLLSGADRHTHPNKDEDASPGIMFYGNPTVTEIGLRFIEFCLIPQH